MSKPQTYSFRGDVGTDKKRLLLYSADHKPGTGPEEVIELIKFNDTDGYIGQIPEDISIEGVQYKKGDLIHYSDGGLFGSDKVYKVDTIKSPKNYAKGEVEYKSAYNKWLGRYITGDHNKNWYILSEGSTGYDSKGNYNILKKGKWVDNTDSASSSPTTKSITNSTDVTNSTSDTNTTTDTSSAISTDSTTRSFDFLDDILGTQKEDSKDKTTELDPNQIANTIVNETKLNDTAISSLVSTYLNSLNRINRSYNTQTK